MTFSGFVVTFADAALGVLERVVVTFRSVVGGMSIEWDSAIEDLELEPKVEFTSGTGEWVVTVNKFAMDLPPGEVKVSMRLYDADGYKYTPWQSEVLVKSDPTAV